jgi:DNA invertase Pin-like site-specific DNA recombinase
MSRARAAVYYRMSDDHQENSIERQQSLVRPYADRHEYEIVREYKDEGIAGDEERKRKDFMRMLRDAQGGEFQVILCDDKDRFGRFDTITQGYYVKPLRDAGVWLETVAQGKVDWSSFSGRITDAVLQEAKKLESQATSRRVITQMHLMARQGTWLGGVAPYGYKVVERPGRTPDAKKWPKMLVPGDLAKVEAVRLIFHLYGEQGYTLDQVAEELHRRGYPSPEGRRAVPHPEGKRCWQKTTIRAILCNRKYLGEMTWNARHDGKYSDLSNGTTRTCDQRIPRRRNRPEDWVIVSNAHEPLVDREVFEKAQQRLVENKTMTSPARKSGGFVLSGLLACGHCGWKLIGTTQQGKRFYKCGRYHQEGKRGCQCNLVMEAKVLPAVVRKLHDEFLAPILNPENLERVRVELHRQAAETSGANAGTTDRLRRRIEELHGQIQQGNFNLTVLPPDRLAGVIASLRTLEAERDRLVRELEALHKVANVGEMEAELRAAEEDLRHLRDVLLDSKPEELREVLRHLVERIELFFEHRPLRGKTRALFRKGVIRLRPPADVGAPASLCNAANPIPAS